jgi:hypothetical protein
MRLHDGAATHAIMGFATSITKFIDIELSFKRHRMHGSKSLPGNFTMQYRVRAIGSGGMALSVPRTEYCFLDEAFARAEQEGNSLNLGTSNARKRRLRNHQARFL